ncbi:uncharacterized protein [Typha angustifolia]|uniref:uncharacterized protein n=1 Tax=Typha angustifolia TaxID=59011 RepID=UPI003C3011DC
MIPSNNSEAAMAEDLATNAEGDQSVKKVKKKKKRKSRRRRRVTQEDILASRYVHDWVFPDSPIEDEEVVVGVPAKRAGRVVFELHSHSTCSDGFLSPSALVERAHKNGVKVLALTDHDTMDGIAEAMEAARKLDIRIIPGVEISAVCSPRDESEAEEPVHILAYYGSWGPARFEELERLLAKIRDGRYVRAKEILLKLSKLEMPLKFEHVSKIAGNGVAPGRLHVARAMVEAGYVENLKQAFSRYLYDGGPAYATGSEPVAEAVVQLISHTGGISALAHPWALKNPVAIIRKLKTAGLHAIEVYRSDGKLSGFSDLADVYELVKLGGSDYHGRSGHEEPDVGSVDLPVLAVFEFLKLARPLWCKAMKEILSTLPIEPSEDDVVKIIRFGNLTDLKGFSSMSCGKDLLGPCLESWLTIEEKEASELESMRVKLLHTIVGTGGYQMTPVSR